MLNIFFIIINVKGYIYLLKKKVFLERIRKNICVIYKIYFKSSNLEWLKIKGWVKVNINILLLNKVNLE